MKPLTARQYATLVFIQDYTVGNGRGPSISQIARYFGVTGSAISKRVRSLHNLGYVAWEPRQPVRVLFVPGMGMIARAA